MVTKELIEENINKLRPSLQQDGGDVEMVDYKEGKVYLRLLGHCRGCPYSEMTLRNGIEQYLKEHVDPALEVVGVQ